MRTRLRILVAALGSVVALASMWTPAPAQERAPVKLWVDEETGQVFTRPGPGRAPLDLGIDAETLQKQIEKQVQQKVDQKAQQVQQAVPAMTPQQQDLLLQNQQQIEALTRQVMEMEPAWRSYVDTWKDKIHIGALFYADWALYTKTGFGPQVLTHVNPPGPGNDLYNSFDVTRTYLNFFFTPTDDWTLRITPNLYRAIGSGTNDKVGKVSGVGTDLDGELGVRIKYGYLRYNSLFENIGPVRGDAVTFGIQANPLVAWEEDLYGFRFVNLTPWNFLSLSSSQAGLAVQGPVKFGGKQYVDYDVGVYDNANFHQFEQAREKQAMARLSYYPFGANWRFDGLGITGFYDYGYGNVAPDNVLATEFLGPQNHIIRAAALVHYTTEQWGIAFEYDWGHNAFSMANLFSGSGPADAFSGLGTTQYSQFTAMVHAILDRGNAEQEGWAAFGHYHIPYTRLTLFAMYEHFLPNTNIENDPIDFDRLIAGVAYQWNEYLRFALSNGNIFYYQPQHTFYPSPYMVKALGVTKPVYKAVPGDQHAIYFNVEFSY